MSRLNFAKFETVRGRWRLHPPCVALSFITVLSPSPPVSLFLFILPFSFARLSSFPPVDPANVLGVPSRPPSRYYGNFEPIRKSIATAAGKSVETACVAGAPRERRASQAWLFQRLRKCNVFYSVAILFRSVRPHQCPSDFRFSIQLWSP